MRASTGLQTNAVTIEFRCSATDFAVGRPPNRDHRSADLRGRDRAELRDIAASQSPADPTSTPRRRWLRALGTHAGPDMARLKQPGRP